MIFRNRKTETQETESSPKSFKRWLAAARQDQRGIETGTLIWMGVGVAAAIGIGAQRPRGAPGAWRERHARVCLK